MDFILAHERAHLRRKDHLWKPFGYLLLCIYWFNPLCWIAYIMLCKDIELACDEKVIKDMSFGDKKEYSLSGFLPENPLKNAEMMLEDDYGMIDGIINNGPKEPTVAELEQQARSGQPISLMDLADAVHRKEREKKKSVMEQLKGQPKTEHKKTAPKKSAEREI